MAFHSEELIRSLTNLARDLRIWVIEMIYCAQSGHPGGSLSAADIVAALYFHHLRLDPTRPDWPERDRFILSKGHAAPLLYAALCERGFFGQECLTTLRCLDSTLQGHPDRLRTEGVEMTAGALGHGLAIGVGLALGARLDGAAYRTYVLLGDGECEAGQIWEAAMAAAHFKTDKIIAILDYNKYQETGPITREMALEPLVEKWKCFGWQVFEVDGHDLEELIEELEKAVSFTGKPCIVIAHTIKGKGFPFAENNPTWHHKSKLTDEEIVEMYNSV